MKLSKQMQLAIWPRKHSPTPYNIKGDAALKWADEVAQLEETIDALIAVYDLTQRDVENALMKWREEEQEDE